MMLNGIDGFWGIGNNNANEPPREQFFESDTLKICKEILRILNQEQHTELRLAVEDMVSHYFNPNITAADRDRKIRDLGRMMGMNV